MRKLFSDVLNAAGVIVGDMIESWGSREPRSHLIDQIRTLAERVDELEDENDRLHNDNQTLRMELQVGVKVYEPLPEYRVVTPPYPRPPVRGDAEDTDVMIPTTTRLPCPNCSNFRCCCIPF